MIISYQNQPQHIVVIHSKPGSDYYGEDGGRKKRKARHHSSPLPLREGSCEKIDYILLPVVMVREPEAVSAGSIGGRKLCYT